MSEKILHTPLCDMLGIKYLILLAGMGGASTPELAAAVCSKGSVQPAKWLKRWSARQSPSSASGSREKSKFTPNQ